MKIGSNLKRERIEITLVGKKEREKSEKKEGEREKMKSWLIVRREPWLANAVNINCYKVLSLWLILTVVKVAEVGGEKVTFFLSWRQVEEERN